MPGCGLNPAISKLRRMYITYSISIKYLVDDFKVELFDPVPHSHLVPGLRLPTDDLRHHSILHLQEIEQTGSYQGLLSHLYCFDADTWYIDLLDEIAGWIPLRY